MAQAPPHGRRLATGGIIALWAAWFAPQLLSSGVPFRRDALYLYLPIRQFLHESLRAGHLPQWYPYEGFGVPFIGQFVTATFHPETLLFLPFSPATALKLNTLGAYLLGLAGGYRFARALGTSRIAAVTGGAALAFSGYALSMSDNLPFLVGLATLPWLGWAAAGVAKKRRISDAALMGLIWALILLAGDVQSFVVAPLLVLATLLATRLTARALALSLLALVLALACSAVELLPGLALFEHSARLKLAFVIDVGQYWALHPVRLLELFVPQLIPRDAQAIGSELVFGSGFRWSITLFAGSLAILLALASLASRDRRTLAFGGLAGLALWLAGGTSAGLLPVAWRLLPPLARFRFPEKYVAFFVVALVPLVSAGVDLVLREPRRWGRRFVLVALAVGAAALTVRHGRVAERLIAVLHPGGSADAGAVEVLRVSWSHGLTLGAGIFAGLGFVLWLGRSKPWIAVAVPVAVSLELWVGNNGYLPLAPPELVSPTASKLAAAMAREADGPPPRLLSTGHARNYSGRAADSMEFVQAATELLRPDVSGLFHVATVGMSAFPGQSERTRAVLGAKAVRARELGPLLGACFDVGDDGHLGVTQPGFRTRDEEIGLTLVGTACRPSAYVASARTVADADAAEAELLGLKADEVVWEDGPAMQGHGGNVHWAGWSPGHLALSVDLPAAAALEVSEAFGDGWRASVDGRTATIHPTNGLAMGVELGPGHHLAAFDYGTPRLPLGLALSLAGLGMVVALLVRGRTARRAS